MVGRRVHRSTIATAYERGEVNPSMHVSAGRGSTLSPTLLSFVLYASDAVPPHQFCPYMVLCRHWCASLDWHRSRVPTFEAPESSLSDDDGTSQVPDGTSPYAWQAIVTTGQPEEKFPRELLRFPLPLLLETWKLHKWEPPTLEEP